MARFNQQRIIRERLAKETGTLVKAGGDLRVALVYPSPYNVGMSSLGYQSIYRVINQDSPYRAERSFLPDKEIKPLSSQLVISMYWPYLSPMSWSFRDSSPA